MRMNRLLMVLVVAVVAWSTRGLPAQGGLAVTGVVTSVEEGTMEGVVVNARRDGANFTVSVVSDAQGRYSFPRTHLEAGRYTLSIRATGFDLVNQTTIEVTTSKAASADLKLQPAKDLAAQLSSREWAMSFPGTAKQQDAVAIGCTSCHTLERIARSKHTADQWVSVLTRMQTFLGDGTAVSGDRGRFQKLDAEAQAAAAKNPNSVGGFTKVEMGEYLATLNLSGGRATWPYELKTLPRPKGAATRVIITQWDLPRKDTVAHDLAIDWNGHPWYNDQSRTYIGTLDPKTGSFTEYPFPPLPEGRPGGVSDLVVDKEGNLWFPLTMPEGRCHFGTPVKFDPKTQKLTYVEVSDRDAVYGGTQNPCGLQFVGLAPDGKIWMNGIQVMVRIDPKTAKIEKVYNFGKGPTVPPGRHMGYQLVLNSKGNAYICDFPGGYVVGVDGETGAVKYYPLPVNNGTLRRGQMDSQDRFWFAENHGNQIGLFDTRTETFREWPLPHPYTFPYTSSAPDKSGRVYLSSNMAERIIRLDPKTSEIIEYQVPTYFDSKKILHDPIATRTTLWFNNKRSARLLRLEPLD